MKSGKYSIILSALLGILICAALAACGARERRSDILPANNNTISDPQPEVSAPLEQQAASPQDGNGEEAGDKDIAPPSPEDDLPEQAVTEAGGETVQATSDAVTGALKDEDGRRADSEKVVTTAAELLGVEYTIGGDSPDEGFDSSGFVYYCVNQAGAKFPRQLKDQLNAGEKISYSDLEVGDAAYFSEEPNGEASFCGIYAGGGLIIYSPVPDEFVKTANITTNYWTSRFVTGIRPEIN